jgi:hypothetical protein
MATLPARRVRTGRAHRLRLLAAAVLSTVLAPVLVATTASPASAEDGYRYWGYFHVEKGAYAFAKTGPGDYTPADGSTEAYRFGTSTAKQGVQPRADLATVTFDEVCGATEPAAGKKRVAVLIDYGTAADASGSDVPDPRADCAQVATGASGQQVLAAVAKIRASKGLVCALDGYPSAGCGDPVKDATVPSDEPTVSFAMPAAADASAADPAAQDDSSSTPLVVGGVVVLLLLVGGGVVLSRRGSAA